MDGDAGILKEMWGLGDEYFEQLGVNDRALEGLGRMLAWAGQMDFQFDGEDGAGNKDKAYGRREDGTKVQQKMHHGLAPLCNLMVKGHPEKVWRLSELFFPKEEDQYIKNKMEIYNKNKMPLLKQTVQPEVLEQRKRQIKADMKRAAEKIRYQARKAIVPSILLADLNYLHNEKLTTEQLDFQIKNKFSNCKNVGKISSVLQEKQNKSLLRQIRQGKAIEELEQSLENQVNIPSQAIENYLANSNLLQLFNQNQQKSTDFQINQQASKINQIEQNLMQIQKLQRINQNDKSPQKSNIKFQDVIQLNDKIENLQLQTEVQSVLEQLSQKEKLILKKSFNRQHFDNMDKMYPPLYTFTQTEKECFLFINSFNFEFYAVNGQDSPQKSLFNAENNYYDYFYDDGQDKVNNIKNQKAKYQNLTLEQNQAKMFNNSIFSCFFTNETLAEEKKEQNNAKDFDQNFEKDDEQIIYSQSQNSSGSIQNIRNRENMGSNEIFQSEGLTGSDDQLKVQIYENGNGVRQRNEISNQKQNELFQGLKQKANLNAAQNMFVKQFKLKRRKYWGELTDGQSQYQIDKDFARYKFYEQRLPIDVLSTIPTFTIETIQEKRDSDKFSHSKLDNQVFKTKYGTLALCGAQQNNFKIDDIKEYEFIQKQRAYLYDPVYLKGSSQLKNFSQQVGFDSIGILGSSSYEINNQQNTNNFKNLQNLKLDIGSVADNIKSNSLQQDPQVLIKFDFLEAEKTKNTFLDARKQKLIKNNQDILNNINDDLDQLTNNVKIKKLKEYIQRRTEENKKNAQNIKKNQSTAYRPTDLLVPKPLSGKPGDTSQLTGGEMSQSQRQVNENGDINMNDNNFSKQMQRDNQRHSQRDRGQPSFGAIQEADNVKDQFESEGENFSFEHRDSFEQNGQFQSSIENQKQKNRVEAFNSSQRGESVLKSLNDDVPSDFTDIDEDELAEISGETLINGLNQNASHAKCILDLSFTKFKWNINEDFSQFHRPNLQNLFQIERNKIQAAIEQEKSRNDQATLKNNSTHISIDANGSLQNLTRDQTFIDSNQVDSQPFVELPVQVIDRETIKRKNKKRGIINADEYFKDRFKLSLKEGKFCCFEHIDENPIFINNFGMVSKLHRYIYSEKYHPPQDFLHKSLNTQLKHMGPYGMLRKGASSRPPLLGNIDRNIFQGISVLSNKLYRAPVFFHKPKYTDFFCSFHQDRKGSKQIIIRELQNIYSVGQIEPYKDVYNPQSRNYQTFIKQHSKAYIIRFLQENNNRLDFREIQHLFSYLTDQMLKKFIKEISVEVNRDQVCSSTKQLSDETIKNLITPEMICRFESALFGEAMLRAKGILNITNADKISYASNKYCSEQRDALKQKISKFIENEVLCTPWNLSSNYCTINSNGGMLMIRGVGDPSNNNGGFSFLKMPLKISSDCFKDCMKIRKELNPAMQNPKSVTGTNADLRKLKKPEIFKMLVDMGYDRKEIQKLTRWAMVGLLRQHSSSLQGTTGIDDKNKRYARGIRYTAKTQREVYHKQVDQLFRTQMIYLTGRKALHDESDLEDPCAQFNIPDNESQSSIQKIDQNPDDSDEEIFNQADVKKYLVEIVDKQKITELFKEDQQQDAVLESFQYPFAPNGIHSGKIRNIKDIPQYKKLLIANIPIQNQAIQSGQQAGLINIGGNSGNQQESFMNYKNAESLLQEKLENKEMTMKCRVLKKVIKSEEEDGQIERVEFNSDPKIIKKFIKRQQKCKTKKDRQRKTGLREKMIQNQQQVQQQSQIMVDQKMDFKNQLNQQLNQATSQQFTNSNAQNYNIVDQLLNQKQNENQLYDQGKHGTENENVIQIPLFEDEDIMNKMTNLNNSKTQAQGNKKNSKSKNIIDLKQIGDQTVDRLLYNRAPGNSKNSFININMGQTGLDEELFKKPVSSKRGGTVGGSKGAFIQQNLSQTSGQNPKQYGGNVQSQQQQSSNKISLNLNMNQENYFQKKTDEPQNQLNSSNTIQVNGFLDFSIPANQQFENNSTFNQHKKNDQDSENDDFFMPK